MLCSFASIVLRYKGRLALSVLAAGILTCPLGAFGESLILAKTLDVGIKDPVVLQIDVSNSDVSIGYSRDGQVSVQVYANDDTDKSKIAGFVETGLLVELDGSRVTISDSAMIAISTGVNRPISYQIDVPFRTQVRCSLSGIGKQKVMGITGPANLISDWGDIDVSYVRFAPVYAKTGKGNISATRLFGVNAETGDGNIVVMEAGSSRARIVQGHGRIEAGGMRGYFSGSTSGGDIHVKAVPHENWEIKSVSGSIRVELPENAKFTIDASTESGEISVERSGVGDPAGTVRQIARAINGGGKLIQLHTTKGNIVIQ